MKLKMLLSGLIVAGSSAEERYPHLGLETLLKSNSEAAFPAKK